MPLINELATITFNPIKSSLGDLSIVIVLNTQIPFSFATNNYTAEELGLEIIGLPNKTVDWNDREFWFGVGNCGLKIYDPLEYLELALRDIYFNYRDSTITVTKTSDLSIWYKGYFDSDSYSKSSDNVVSMTFNPLTEQLALTAVNNGSGTDGWNDIYNGKYAWDIFQYYDVYTFILDTLKLIDPTMTIQIINDWDFQSAESGGVTGTCKLVGSTPTNGLRVSPKRLFGRYANGSTWQWETANYKDVINLLSRSLGLMISFPSYNEAVLSTYLDTVITNLFIPDYNHEIKSYNRTKQETKIKFLRIKNRTGSEIGGYGVKQITSAGELDITTLDDSAFSVPHPSASIPIQLSKIRRSGTEVFVPYGDFLAPYYGAYYTNNYCQLKDTIEILNTDLLITDKLLFKGYIYYPLSLDYDIEKSITKIIGRPFAKIAGHNVIEYPVIDENLYQEPETPNTNMPGFQYGNHIINELITITNGIMEYALINNYQFNSLEVFRNGQKQTKDVDYTETSNELFTFLIPVTSDEKISVNYYIL